MELLHQRLCHLSEENIRKAVEQTKAWQIKKGSTIGVCVALFSFVPNPENKRAERDVAHPDNTHYVSTLSDGTLALDVGFHICGKSYKTLVTLGQGVNADIYMENSSIAKVQCSFEVDLDTGVVMFCDRSFAKSSQVFGENATPFRV